MPDPKKTQYYCLKCHVVFDERCPQCGQEGGGQEHAKPHEIVEKLNAEIQKLNNALAAREGVIAVLQSEIDQLRLRAEGENC